MHPADGVMLKKLKLPPLPAFVAHTRRRPFPRFVDEEKEAAPSPRRLSVCSPELRLLQPGCVEPHGSHFSFGFGGSHSSRLCRKVLSRPS